jgi:hypothetical protein
VPQFVRKDDPHLAGAQAAVEQGVPQDDAGRGPDADRVGVDLVRVAADLLDGDGRSGDVLDALEPRDVRAIARGNGVRPRARNPAAEEREADRECDEHGAARDPPARAEPAREAHDEHDRPHGVRGLEGERGPRGDEPLEVMPRGEPVPVIPPLQQDPERERDEPERDQRQHPHDHAAADRAEADAPGDPRGAPDEDGERGDRRDRRGQPHHVDEALVAVRAAQLGVREVAVHVEPAEVEVRNARPEEQPREEDPGGCEHG